MNVDYIFMRQWTFSASNSKLNCRQVDEEDGRLPSKLIQ